MILDNILVNNKILETGLQASVVKNEVIQNNIANAETPGFKRKTVEFDSILNRELDNFVLTGELNLDKAKPTIHSTGMKYRLDENNVDIETEMVDLYQNSVKYDTLASAVMNNYKRINLVLNTK